MDKRTADSRSLTEKEVLKADLEAELQSLSESKSAATKELGAATALMGHLHGSCDWLLQYFDERKEARASEISSLGDAKAVLAGADFSMLQMGTEGRQGQLAASRGYLRASRA